MVIRSNGSGSFPQSRMLVYEWRAFILEFEDEHLTRHGQ